MALQIMSKKIVKRQNLNAIRVFATRTSAYNYNSILLTVCNALRKGKREKSESDVIKPDKNAKPSRLDLINLTKLVFLHGNCMLARK